MKDQLGIILAHCPVWPEGLPRTSKPPSSTCQNSHSWATVCVAATQRQLAAFQSLHSADQPAGIDFWLDEHMLGLLLCVPCSILWQYRNLSRMSNSRSTEKSLPLSVPVSVRQMKQFLTEQVNVRLGLYSSHVRSSGRWRQCARV